MQKNRIYDRAKILLINEDESIFYLIRRVLVKENYRVYISKTAKQGMEMSTSICPDVILMNMQMPDMDGVELIQWFCSWSDCPILVISEIDDYKEKVEALYAGADDYIVRPFHEQELEARVYAALRRRIPSRQGICYEAGNLKIDFTKRQVSVSGEEVHFPPMEYRILEYLALNAGTVVTYQMLLEKIWGPYANSSSRILRVNMTNIRKKIEEVPTMPSYIVTIPRVGYRMLENQYC